ncbi:MAG: hypothetical protein AAF226_05180 [Verrucomicrobiota bacterium]
MKKPIPLLVCLLVPLLFLVAGIAAAGFYGYQRLPELLQTKGKGKLPGTFAITLGDAPKYSLWHHYKTEFEDELYDSDPIVNAETKVRVVDLASGETLTVNKMFDAKREILEDRSAFIGTFDSPGPDSEIEVIGTGLSEPTIISVSPANMQDTLGAIFGIAIIALTGLMLAIATLIFLLHKRSRQLAEIK